jgi:geranylgeranyl diphosphate synthase, type II
MNIKKYLVNKREVIDKELGRFIPLVTSARPKVIYKAITYALKNGKRIRPILCLACAEASGAKAKDALAAACAIEMVHTYSLIHDDLPCMDNDDYRRGRLTVHKKFGFANAVLTGDALLTEAFNVLASATTDDSVNIELVKILSHAAGISGMIAGQAVDIARQVKDMPTQEYINIHKTGVMIAASCKMGAVSAMAGVKEAQAFYRFGEYIGLVFQLIDDMIDSEGSLIVIGKKRTFEYAKELTESAKNTLKGFGKKSDRLCQIADFILNRKT